MARDPVNRFATAFDQNGKKTTDMRISRITEASGHEARIMSFVLDGIGRLMARYLEKPVQGYEPFTPSDFAALQTTPPSRRRAAGRRQQSRFRHHQISHAIHMVACRAVCRPHRRSRKRRGRTADTGGSQSRRRRRSARRCRNTRASTPAFAGRPVLRRRIAPAFAPMRPSASASITT